MRDAGQGSPSLPRLVRLCSAGYAMSSRFRCQPGLSLGHEASRLDGRSATIPAAASARPRFPLLVGRSAGNQGGIRMAHSIIFPLREGEDYGVRQRVTALVGSRSELLRARPCLVRSGARALPGW